MSVNTYLPPSPVIPQFLIITNIVRGMFTVVTVSTENTYVVGQVVYCSIPRAYSIIELNGVSAEIIRINGLDITLNVNSTNFNEFTTPSLPRQIRPAALSPAGSRNIYNITTEPFHSEGNFGN